MFIINLKNYLEASGANGEKLASICSSVSKRSGVGIVIAPSNGMLSELAKRHSPIFAQHLDNAMVGSTTGYMIPEVAKSIGVSGSLINHSEHRISEGDIASLVQRLRNLGLASVVCVRDNRETERYAKLAPDYIAIEPPGLIGSGKAVSKERPELISDAARVVKKAGNATKLLCGAGIVSGEDVSKAVQLGAKGILVASGIVKAPDWKQKIEEFSGALKE